MDQNPLTEAFYGQLSTRPLVLVVIGRPSCDDCTEWSSVLDGWQPEQQFNRLEVVHLDLNSPVGQRFCAENEWTTHIDSIPFNVLYEDGEPTDQWPGGSLDRLKSSLEKRV
ncbi:MAG: hypothetical protein HOI79_01680 [Euryarchaeota archaeon]|nr:hypothetical protein [Euryarchaeota archaeon]